MKNLLIIVAGLGLGGQERVALNTARGLKDKYNVKLLIFGKSQKEYDHSDVDVINVNIPAKNGRISKVLNVIKRIFAVKKIKKALKIDIAYSFGTSANIVNSFSKYKEKTILSIRGFESFEGKRVGTYIHNRADASIGISFPIAEKLHSLYNLPYEKIKLLNNPIYIDEILAKSKEPVDDYDFAKPTIVASGRLAEIKGFEHLIRSFSIVKKEIPDVKLLILGEGDLRPKLENVVRLFNLQDSVTLLGHRANPFKYVSKARLAVLSSENEGFPNALVEQMCLLPVVAVDCLSGPREILSRSDYKKIAASVELSDFGILTPPVTKSRNYQSAEIEDCDKLLAKGILTILSDDALYSKYKKVAKERVTDFSVENHLEKLVNIFEN